MKATEARNPASDYRSLNPLRGLDWRWRVALRHCEQGTRPEPWEDPLIRDIVCLLRSGGSDPSGSRLSGLAAAHCIHSAASPLRDEIGAHILAGQTFDVIAAKTGTTTEAIAAYEGAFFDVAAYLNAQGWINFAVLWLRPGGFVTEGHVWKCVAYNCGTEVLDLMVDEFHQRPAADPDDRAQTAAKCRFIVRMNATDWASPTAVRLMLAEARELTPHLFDPHRPGRNPYDALHIKTLEMFAHADLPPAPARTRKPKDGPTRPRRPRKGRRHGRCKQPDADTKPNPASAQSRRGPAAAVQSAG